MISKRFLFLIIYTVVILVFLFAVFAFILYLNQSNYVYFPTSNIITTPSDSGLFYEDLMLETYDGVKISAWYIHAENPKATLLFFHGNAGNISHRIEFIEMFYSLNISTFIIDYRGYGKSEGSPTEEGTYIDSEAAWDYLRGEKNIDPSSIVIYGKSLGGPVAARLAEEHNPAALILDSTFTSIKDLAVEIYPFLPVKKFFKFEYDTVMYLEGADCPTLIIHSIDDSYIPFSHAERLFDAVGDKKELAETRGDHNTSFMISRDIYIKSIDNILKSITKPD
jgi:fermentation-respiration switch protein FrsA (DUF1100 family)